MKKFTLLLMAMLVAMVSSAATRVYFLNDASPAWGAVAAYVFEPEEKGWPGTVITSQTEEIDGTKYYYYDVANGAKIIFNNNNNGQQTENLNVTANAVYSYTANNNQNGTIDPIGTIEDGHFVKAGEVEIVWAHVYFPVSTYNHPTAYFYTWTEQITAGWPGTQLTKQTVNDTEYWVFEVDSRKLPATCAGLQLNEGSDTGKTELNAGNYKIEDGTVIDINKGILDEKVELPKDPEPEPEPGDTTEVELGDITVALEATTNFVDTTSAMIPFVVSVDSVPAAGKIEVYYGTSDSTMTTSVNVFTAAADTVAPADKVIAFNDTIELTGLAVDSAYVYYLQARVVTADSTFSTAVQKVEFKTLAAGEEMVPYIAFTAAQDTTVLDSVTAVINYEIAVKNLMNVPDSVSVCYGIAGDSVAADTIVVAVGKGTIELEGLTPDTEYNYYLYAVADTLVSDSVFVKVVTCELEATAPEHVYIIGSIVGNTWNPAEGLEMTATAAGVYEYNGLELENGAGASVAYFALTTVQTSDWDEVNANRFGPAVKDTEIVLNKENEVTKNGAEDTSWSIAAGTYKVVFDWNEMTLTVTEAEGVEDLDVEINDVPAVYYNLQGVRISEPAAGQIYIRVQGSNVSKVIVR